MNGSTQAKPRGRTRLPLAFAPLALTYLAVALNMTVASVALPTISTDLSASASQLVWIVNITPMASAALILFAGSWGDRLGRRRILQLGVLVFLTSAVLSSMATSVNQLIALRGLTGVGSALVMPAAMALTFDVVAEPSRKTAVGIIGATQAVGALLGPLVAGSLLVAFSWGAAFLSVTPLLVISVILTHIYVPKDRPAGENREPVDNMGATLMAVAGLALLFAAVTAASTHGGSRSTALVAAIVGVLALVALFVWERRCAHPIFVGSIVASTRFWVPTLTIGLVQFILGGFMFANTQYIQLVLGFSAFAAGLFLMPALLMWMLSSSTVGVVTAKLGDRNVVVGGLLLSAVGLVLISTGGVHPKMPILILGLLLVGCMGVGPALLTHMAVSAYPTERRTVGSAINSVAVRMGLAFGVAAFGSVVAAVFAKSLKPALAALTPTQAGIADNSLGGALKVAAELSDSAAAALTHAARMAYVDGFRTALLIAAVLVLGIAVLDFFTIPRRSHSSVPQEVQA